MVSDKNEIVVAHDLDTLYSPALREAPFSCVRCGEEDPGHKLAYKVPSIPSSSFWRVETNIASVYAQHVTPGFYCFMCLCAIDKSYIEGIPIDRLPLYINQRWFTEPGARAYRARLGAAT